MKTIHTRIENIDTDQIIPARFLKKTVREGFGEAMFHDWRYNSTGEAREESIFARYEQSPVDERPKILVAGRNFGCGSSREHAAWELADYGFKAVVSSFFADIFRNNALNNMLLPVQVSGEFLERIFEALEKWPQSELEIDLEEKKITLITGDGKMEHEFFPIGEYKQQCLLNNQSDMDFLVSTRNRIEEFEKTDRQ